MNIQLWLSEMKNLLFFFIPVGKSSTHVFLVLPTLLLSISLLMDVYVDLCCSFGLPVWMASLLHTAKRLRSDHARRRKVYHLLRKKLMLHSVGVTDRNLCQPTYVFPEEVKMLARSAFPKSICDYPNPCHDQVVYITVEDLHKVEIN